MAHKLTHPGSGGWLKHTGVPKDKPPSADRYPKKPVVQPKYDTYSAITKANRIACQEFLGTPQINKIAKQKMDNTQEEKPKIFFICPVRNIKPKVQKRNEAYVQQLEQEGYNVHWPARDTDQNDPIGLAICEANRAAINRADEIHIWFDPQSQGSLFDIGMAFAFLLSMRKRIVIANRHEVQRTPHKSFQNVLLELSLRTRE